MSILNLLSMKMKLSRIKIVLLMVSIAILLLKQIYAAKQVRQSYNPITAYTHSKMDKWAVGQTEMLNYALVDNITASGIDIYECATTTYLSSMCFNLTTLAANVTAYNWTINQTVLQNFTTTTTLKQTMLKRFTYDYDVRYLLFYPEGSVSLVDRFYTGYKLFDKTQLSSFVFPSWIENTPALFIGSTLDLVFKIDPELPNQKYIVYSCIKNEYSADKTNDCRILTKNGNDGVLPISTNGKLRTLDGITIPTNTYQTTRYIILYTANNNLRESIYKQYKPGKRGALNIYINDNINGAGFELAGFELCANDDYGEKYKIKWTPMLHIDVKTTYTPESVIFYECPVDEKIPKLQQEIYAYNVGNNPSMSCVLIGVSNAWNEINYVPSLNIGNPRNINYVMSGFDNWMKTIGQFRVVNCQHEEEEEEEEEGDNIFQEDNGGDQDMDILIYLGLIPALVILNEAIKYIIFELKLKTYISQGKIDQFKYWKRNTENPTNDDAIGFDLVGLAVRTKQGKDSVELSFSKCPRCSKMVKKPPGTLVFQCFGCGSMLIQSIDGTKYVEADYKREMDERYKFHTEAIDAISRNVKQTINVFSFNVNQILEKSKLKVTSHLTTDPRAGNISCMGRRARRNNFARVYDTAKRANIERRNYAGLIEGDQKPGESGDIGANGVSKYSIPN